MSYENKGKSITLISDAAYNTRYVAVKQTNVPEVFTICLAGDAPVGILQYDTPANQACEIMVDGVSFMVAGAAIAAGASIAAGAGGVAVTAQGGATPFGIALNAAAAAGDIISVLMKPVGNPAATAVIMTYTSANLAADADITAGVVGVAAFDGELVGAKIVSTGAAAGIDAANTSKFELKVGAVKVSELTFDDAVLFPGAGEVADLPLVPPVAVQTNDVITLDVTNGATADLPVFVVQLFFV